MASALQKLFRKRISKQQLLEQRQRQEAEAAAEAKKRGSNSPRNESQPYLTVSSLNSPSSSTVHFPFSSKVSLSSYSAQIGEDGAFSNSPQRQDNRLLRHDSNGSYHDSRPRAASLSAASMMRDLSDSSERRRISAYHEVDTLTDQFGTLLEGNIDRETQGPSGGDEEELDENPLYAALTQRSSLHCEWNMAKLVLVPSKAHDIRQQDMKNDAYIGLHAMQPSNLFKDQYVSVRSTKGTSSTPQGTEDQWGNTTLTATLEAESRTVQLVMSRPTGRASEGHTRLEHTASVLNETTVYRSMTNQEASQIPSSPSATQGQKRNRRERIRIRILTIDGLVVPDDAHTRLLASENPPQPGETPCTGSEQTLQTQLESRQKQQKKESITFPQGSPELDQEPNSTVLPLTSGAHSTGVEVSPVPLRRQFLADFAFLLDPPQEMQPLKEPLRAALDTLLRAASEFISAYVYVSGFDAYNVSRIRRGILSRAWQAFEMCMGKEGDTSLLGPEGRARMLLLLENVVMGHCHGKIYSSIQTVYRSADEAVDNVLCTYQELQVSLDDLGVGFPAICRRPAFLDRAIFIAKHLGDADEDMEHLLVGCNIALIRSLAKQGDLTLSDSSDSVYYTPERNRGRIRTPLDVFDVLQATLEEIGIALAKASKSSLDKTGALGTSLGTDELLPVLAYVLIRAGPMKLVSLLYYARQFGLSDAISSQSNWALVTHDAVIEYLRKDPLHLCSVKSPTCGSSVHSISSERTLIHSPMTRSSTQMERKLEGWRRDRRCSLPGSILLSSIHSELSDSTLPSCVSSDLPSSVSHTEGAEDQSAGEAGFKLPGRPASAYAVTHRSRLMSALDVVGEDGFAGADSHPSAAQSFSRPASNLSKRTTSMTGSGDLHIRPQIVVRSTKGSSRSPVSSIGSRDCVITSDIITSHQEKNLERTLSLGSKRMSRTGSEEPPHCRLDPGAAAVQVPKQTRRKSLDSWSSFSFFGSGAASLLSTPEGSGAASSSTVEISPSNSSQGYPATPTGLASSPTMWLSSWTSDWMQKRKESLPSTGEQRISIDTGSRPGSVTNSNEDAMAPLRTYSFSSSKHRPQSEDTHAIEQRRRRPAVRQRLLSTSTATEPLPPKVYPDTATGDYFHRKHSYLAASPTDTPLDASVRLHSALTPNSELLTPQSLLDSNPHTPSFLTPSIGNIQVPTPVEEVSDPMCTTRPL